MKLNNEIRYDAANDPEPLLKCKFEKLYNMIFKLMPGSGLVWVGELNYPLFAASTTSNFDLDPRMKFQNRYWLIIKNPALEPDQILVFPDR